MWIAQWRPGHGPRPGSALHRWLEARHPGWSRLVDCHGRTDVVSAIKAATWFARDGKASPILHLDADCDAQGTQSAGEMRLTFAQSAGAMLVDAPALGWELGLVPCETTEE